MGDRSTEGGQAQAKKEQQDSEKAPALIPGILRAPGTTGKAVHAQFLQGTAIWVTGCDLSNEDPGSRPDAAKRPSKAGSGHDTSHPSPTKGKSS
ncbi:MAG: hypothetical protein E7K72_08870 [Roseomonas mucosa]|nr:hypothetical protein [Roseomonas mucosa]